MKIAAIQPLSLSDFPGHSAAIVFTVGCNLRCPYCHNKTLWVESHPLISELTLFDFLQAKSDKLDGVVVTGGEPTIQPDLVTFIHKIKLLNYKIKLNTNGTNPDRLRVLIKEELLDYIAMDIKAPLLAYHKFFGPSVKIENIKTSIELISFSNLPHKFRTVYDPTLLKPADIEEIKASLPIEHDKESNFSLVPLIKTAEPAS